MLNELGKNKARLIAERFSDLLNALEAEIGSTPENGREMAIVRTKLQEACFFAKRAMAVQPASQERKENEEITK
jgi:hypothetical protein